MQAPVTAAAKGCNKTLIIRQRTEPDLPRLNFTCLINPEVHHLLMQGIKIPTLLISNATRPIEKSIELKRTKTLNPEPGFPLQFVQAHQIAKTENTNPKHADSFLMKLPKIKIIEQMKSSR